MKVILSISKKCFGKTNKHKIIYAILLLVAAFFLFTHNLNNKLVEAYYNQYSVEIQDRNGHAIRRSPNYKGHYLQAQTNIPEDFKRLLVKKEDRFFYYHPGINPVSIFRAIFRYTTIGKPGGSSTITQQLVKILLGNEQNRTIKTKLTELLYTTSLELHLSKATILNMYANSVYLGNQVQGFAEASQMYFGKKLSALSEMESISLLATISSPSTQNPWKSKNESAAKALASRFNIEEKSFTIQNQKSYHYQQPAFFELQSMGISCAKTCTTTIDQDLTEQLRSILGRNILYSYDRGVRNGAIIVIKTPKNELLSIVGSHDPKALLDGSQINMALEPRPIGSTVKPFIYVEGFKKGLRPYTQVEDQEYKYPIATGYPLYPKNYDGKYRGTVTLHEALSNSLNVPSVKVLDYVGLENFYDFLEQDLTLLPIQPLDTYQFGIALGGLEIDLLTLSHFFSIFTNNGVLSPLSILQSDGGIISKQIPPQSHIEKEKKIANPKYVHLINKILNDRKTGVEQFGLVSNLNLTQNNYAVKTGTSRDFHDSWVVGYTPDFIVGVWLGNSENTPLKQVSGQTGAGRVWQEAMELMFTTEYNKKTPFSFSKIAELQIGNSLEYGLPSDIYEQHRNLLEEDILILSPHDEDVFELTKNASIPLIAKQEALWFIDGKSIGDGKKIEFNPTKAKTYDIRALSGDQEEFLQITIISPR